VSGIEALVETLDDGRCIVRSPRVGIYGGGPIGGERKSGGDAIGRLSVLGRADELLLPAGVGGLVVQTHPRVRPAPVEYAQELFRLDPAGGAGPSAPNGESPQSPRAGFRPAPGMSAGAAGTDAPLAEGCHAVRSPIDGIFYQGPAPGAAPFVRPGDVVGTGRTLGLIEAMKTFNAVTYGGAGLPSPALVVEVRAGDATEVKQGALLFVVKSA
jgi:acetyl-CoA carboxylase biotin carboxyl carrier protein